MGEDEVSSDRPVAIPFFNENTASGHQQGPVIIAVEAGGLHSLALSSNGKVHSFSENFIQKLIGRFIHGDAMMKRPWDTLPKSFRWERWHCRWMHRLCNCVRVTRSRQS